MNIKSSKIKEKVCETCGLQESCGDLPGFCLLLNYVPIVIVVVMLSYFLINMTL